MDGPVCGDKPRRVAGVEREYAQKWLLAILDMNVPYSARQAVKGWGACVGLTVQGNNPVVGWFGRGKETFVRQMNNWLEETLNTNGLEWFSWTSMQINVNTLSKYHTDKNNVGPSIILVLGDHTEGEFQVEGYDPVVGCDTLWLFNGKDKHRSMAFNGVRVSIVWFAHASWMEASQEQLSCLKDLGFRLPEGRRQEVATSNKKEEYRRPRTKMSLTPSAAALRPEIKEWPCQVPTLITTPKQPQEGEYRRPVANLAFYEGCGTVALVMQRLLVKVVAHLSWEIDETTNDLLQTRFPKVIEKGDAEKATVEEILQTLKSSDLQRDTLVVITGGPPCVDHSRVKGNRAKGHKGKEGRKLLALARLIMQLKRRLPWETVFLVEHVVPKKRATVGAVERILRTEAF